MQKKQKFEKINLSDSDITLIQTTLNNSTKKEISGFSIKEMYDLINENRESAVNENRSIFFKLLKQYGGREPVSIYLLIMDNKVFTMSIDDYGDYFEAENIVYIDTHLDKTTNSKTQLYAIAEISSEAMLALSNGKKSLYFPNLKAPTLEAASSNFFIRNELIDQKKLAKSLKSDRIELIKNIWTAMKMSAIPLFLYYLGDYFGFF